MPGIARRPARVESSWRGCGLLAGTYPSNSPTIATRHAFSESRRFCIGRYAMLNRTESEHQPLGRQKSRRLCERPSFYRRRRAGREISTGQSRICPLHPVADSCLLRIVKC